MHGRSASVDSISSRDSPTCLVEPAPRSRTVASDDDLAGFESGDETLDSWLRSRALRNESEGASRTYVVAADAKVIAYYLLAVAAIPHAEVTARSRRNMPDPFPAMLLARLAVGRAWQARRLGANLLCDAIRRTLAAAEIAGIRVLLVHAIDDAAQGFSAHFGFEASPTDPMHLMLVRKDARRAGLEPAWSISRVSQDSGRSSWRAPRR